MVSVSGIPVFVKSDFRLPESNICGRHFRSLAPFMAVPEAAINHDNFLVAMKDYVWFSREIGAM